MNYNEWLRKVNTELDRLNVRTGNLFGGDIADYPQWDWDRIYRSGLRPEDAAATVIRIKQREN